MKSFMKGFYEMKRGCLKSILEHKAHQVNTKNTKKFSIIISALCPSS